MWINNFVTNSEKKVILGILPESLKYLDLSNNSFHDDDLSEYLNIWNY